MKKNGWGNNYGLLLKYFQERLEKIYRKYGKTMIAWGELLLTNKEYPVPKDVIIQAWQQPQHLKQVVQRGYRAIHSGRYYLDMTTPGKSRYLWQDTWKDFYENEPFALNLTKEEQKLVLGGEACMWGENVDDSVLNERVWPRAAAVAERLWSPMGIKDLKAAEKRLIHFRCNVLIKRGYAASAIYPDYCPYIYMRRWTPSPLYNFNF
jgi:hexosaminidase